MRIHQFGKQVALKRSAKIPAGTFSARRHDMSKDVYDLPVRVLLYKEESQTVAHALEMDLLEYGSGEKEALKALLRSIKNQISFASHKGSPEMVYFPAEPALFKRWERAHEAQLKGVVATDKSTTLDVKAVVIRLPAEQVIKARATNKFARDRDALCA
jgi:hypothetical protein